MLATSCKKEVVTQYEINEVTLYASASEKKNLKSDEQFLSIMYTDITRQSISNDELSSMVRAYTSMGDKTLVIDVLTKSLLTLPQAEIADKDDMRKDVEGFIEETFKRFYIRKPTAQESWFLANQIEGDKDIGPIDIYYALLVSDEYRYY